MSRISNQNISFIIPAKNESASVGGVVLGISERYPGAEIIVVDDGSTDGTAKIAERSGATVMSQMYSKGNGAAIKAGARAAKGDVLVFLDGDGQHRPEDASLLIGRINEGYDLVVGARSIGGQASVGRGLANGFYNKLATYMTGHRVDDLTSGFRAVRAEKFKEFLYLLPNGFSYPTTSTMAFFRAGYSVKYVPIHVVQREGKSHIKPLKDGMRFLLIIFKVGTLYSPLKLFTPAAVIFFMMGLGWYGYTFTMMNRFTNMSALLFTSGFMLFMMGLISEQITALMYKEK